MPPPEQLIPVEPTPLSVPKHPFWGSCRMAYAICAFLSMVFQHVLRTIVATSILCMIEEPPRKPATILREKYVDSSTDKLHWTREQALYFPTVFYFGYVTTMPFAGYLADKYGGKMFFIGSMVAESIVFMLLPISAKFGYELAIALRVLQGVFAGVGAPAIYEMFTEWAHPKERTACIAFGYTGFNVANLASPSLAAYLCQLPWELMFYIVGSVTLGGAIVMNWIIYNSIDSHPRISRKEYEYLNSAKKVRTYKRKIPWKKIWTCLPFYIFIFTHLLHSFQAGMEGMMLSRFFKEAMQFTIHEAGIWTTVVFSGSISAKIIAIVLSSQVEKKQINLDLYRKILHCACTLTVVPCVVGIIFTSIDLRWLVVVLWTVICIVTDLAFSAAYWPSISFLAPSFAGLLTGIANAIGSSSVIFVSLVISELVPTGTRTEWNWAIGTLIGFNVVEAIIFITFGSTKLQPWGLIKSSDENETKSEFAKFRMESILPSVAKHRFWGSCRMAYAICAFVSMVIRHTLRAVVATSILCMVPELSKKPEAFIFMYLGYEEKSKLQWTREQVLFFPTVFYFGFVVTLPIAGYLAYKYGGKWFFIGSMMAESVTFAVLPISIKFDFALAIAFRVLQGAFSGVGASATYEMFTEWAHPKERTACIAFGYAGFNVANLISPMLAALFCHFSWEIMFYVLGSIGFAVALTMNWIIYNSIDSHPRISRKEYEYLKSVMRERTFKVKIPWKKIWTCLPFYIFIFTHLLHSFQSGMAAMMLSRFFKEAMQYTNIQAGIWTTVVFCGSIVAKIIAIVLSSQVEKKQINLDLYRKVLHCACTLTVVPSVVGIIFISIDLRWLVVVLWTIICVVTDIAFSAAYWPSISFLAPSFAGLLTGIANAIGSSSVIFVSLVISQLVPTGTRTEWNWAIGTLIGFNVVEAIIFISFGSTKLQPWGLIRPSDEIKTKS